jgi:hypothetical protein
MSTNKSSMVLHACSPSYAGGIGRRITIQANHPSTKDWKLAQVVEHLPSQGKALSSFKPQYPVPPEKKAKIKKAILLLSQSSCVLSLFCIILQNTYIGMQKNFKEDSV